MPCRIKWLLPIFLGAALLTTAPAHAGLHPQVDHTVFDAVIPAAVQIAISADEVSPEGHQRENVIPVGSGAVISADGLILTAAHVVDMPTHRRTLKQRDLLGYHMELDESQVLILGTEGDILPAPRYTATILEHNPALDLALLQITGDDLGLPYDPAHFAVPFVPLGNSDAVWIGDPIDTLSYPGMAGGGLTYTTGVVSGFAFEDRRDPSRRTAIMTDATISGGSSGGMVVNRRAELVGIITGATRLDCRLGVIPDWFVPDDESQCVPVGGSVAKLLPINAARSYLEHTGYGDRLPGPPAATPASEDTG